MSLGYIGCTCSLTKTTELVFRYFPINSFNIFQNLGHHAKHYTIVRLWFPKHEHYIWLLFLGNNVAENQLEFFQHFVAFVIFFGKPDVKKMYYRLRVSAGKVTGESFLRKSWKTMYMKYDKYSPEENLTKRRILLLTNVKHSDERDLYIHVKDTVFSMPTTRYQKLIPSFFLRCREILNRKKSCQL